MPLKVLSTEQVDQFMELGYVKLEEAYPRKDALTAQDIIWEHMAKENILRDDPSTWTQPMFRIPGLFNTPEFQICNTDRLADAMEDLVGEGRLITRYERNGWGSWPVNFSSGSEKPWDVPNGAWHWDGGKWRQSVDSPHQGLLLLCMFSSTQSHGGGTLLVEGSHRIVTRYLGQFPDGTEASEAIPACKRGHPWLAELTGVAPDQHPGGRIAYFMEQTYTDDDGNRLRVSEATSEPGDVYLGHPFLFHCPSQNHIGTPRFMCNRTTPLKEPMNVRPDNPNPSPLETSICRALS